MLASGSRDDTVRLWNANTGQLTRTLSVDMGRVDSIAFSPDGHTLASGSLRSGDIRLWNVATGELKQVLPAHRKWVRKQYLRQKIVE